MIDLTTNAISQLAGAYMGAEIFKSFINLIIALIALLVFTGIIKMAFNNDKSYRYRRTYTDLYIVSMIRRFADKDQIDLDEEYKKYANFEARGKPIDSVIEDNINAKIEADTEKIKKENNLQ